MTETAMLTAEAVQEATLKNLEGKLDDDAIRKFLDAAAGLPHIPASASLNFAGIVGWVKCHPTEKPCSEYTFETQVWGAGGSSVDTAVGTLSTSIGWDSFFKETTGCHVQVTAYMGGWLQINFFRQLELIGQFNGLVVGAGLVEAGGNGSWSK